ncbi:MAG: complement resistance protein TraT [Planctomycetes bacterium]|nr:complement resistance protein TraT [Planctomycetota bacterium]
MHTFADNLGRTWYVAINVATIRRVRDVLDVDLYQLVDDGMQALGRLVSDPVRLADVLYVLCKDDADAKNISDEDFGRALAGDAITAAAEAFVEELVDFFPDERSRAALRRVIAAGREVRTKLLDHAETMLEALNPDECANSLINSWTNSPASSALTPVPSSSGNWS